MYTRAKMYKFSKRRKREKSENKIKNKKQYTTNTANKIVNELSKYGYYCVTHTVRNNRSESIYIILSHLLIQGPDITIRVSMHDPVYTRFEYDVYVTSPREGAITSTEAIQAMVDKLKEYEEDLNCLVKNIPILTDTTFENSGNQSTEYNNELLQMQ
jgi:hypothetical protein